MHQNASTADSSASIEHNSNFSLLIGKQQNKSPSDLSVSEAQFLGGSDETTHLIKGLDVTLLARVREEIAALQKSKNEIGRSNLSSLKGRIDVWARRIVFFLEGLSDKLKDSESLSWNRDSTCPFTGLHYKYPQNDHCLGAVPAILLRTRILSSKRAGGGSGTCIPLSKDLLQRIKESTLENRVRGKINLLKTPQPAVKSSTGEDDDIFTSEDLEAADEVIEKKEESSPMESRSDEPYENDDEILRKIYQRLSSAKHELEEMDKMETQRKAEMKAKLTRVQSSTLNPEENPFSLKNASLLPLMNKDFSQHFLNQTRHVEIVRPGDATSDKVDAEYGITQVDIDEGVAGDSIKTNRHRKTSGQNKNDKK